MTQVRVLLVLAVFGALGGCGENDSDPPAKISEPSKGPSAPAQDSVLFEMAPVMVGAGKESMYCHYLPPLESDLVVRGFSTHQSEGGHHLVIYRAIEPKPAGTVVEWHMPALFVRPNRPSRPSARMSRTACSIRSLTRIASAGVT